MFIGLTSEHDRELPCGRRRFMVDCRSEDDVWRSARTSRGHRHHRAATGSTGPTTGTAPRALHSVHGVESGATTGHESSIWGRRRVLLLNSTYEPLTALPMRRAIIMVMCGKADVVHDDPLGAGDPLGDPHHRRSVGDPAADLRAGAVPRPRPDDPGGADAPRPVPLRLLRGQGRHRRPRHSAQPRWRPFVGELRGCVLGVQSPQGRPAAHRAGLGAARHAACRPRDSIGGCCPASRNWIRPG